METKLKKREGN